MAHVMTRRTKFILDEDQIPRAWYNIAADLPVPPSPYLHPATLQPIGPDDLAPLFPMALIGQEVSADREIEIPEPVREAYALYRPSPLYRAHRLEAALDTPAHIYYKYEGVARPAATSPTRRSPRLTTTRNRASPGSRPRPAPASGGARWRSPAPTSGSRSRSTWSARATTRSRTAGSSWRRTARRSSPARRRRRTTAARSSRRRRTARARSASRSARRSRTPRPARTRSTRSGRCSITFCSTRPSSARRRSSRWAWPASRRTSSSAAPAADRTSPG